MSAQWRKGNVLAVAELCGQYGLPREEVQSFQGMIRIYPQGELIIREGDDDRTLFVLRHGRVAILKAIEAGKQERLGTIAAINIFGEMALLNNEGRNASVMAVSDEVLVYAIEKPNLNVILANPRWSEMLVVRLSQNLAGANRQITQMVQKKHWLEEQLQRLEQERDAADALHRRLMTTTGRVLGVILAYQKTIEARAVVKSKGWAYLHSLSRLTRGLIREYLPETLSSLEPVDEALLQEALRKWKEPHLTGALASPDFEVSRE